MKNSPDGVLGSQDLIGLARQSASPAGCKACAALVCPGWESLPASFDRARLRKLGTLRQPGDAEPSFEEHHPGGTSSWSVDAPVAPAFFPYNRCDLWECTACARKFLRYTEYGGYYEDERIRELRADLVVDPAPPTP